MRLRKLAAPVLLLGTLSLGVAACGEEDGDGGTQAAGNNLTIYSSLPMQGASRPQTTAMVNGVKLALERQGGRVGKFRITYKALDDSTAQAGSWTPEATSANARKAAQDKSTIVYIGEFNSGASAISMPILNEAQVPQISPANTAVGLTTNEPGADKGEPDKYYPTGKRHYLRIVPKDTIQGAALVQAMKQEGCTKVAITNDKEVYGAGLARNVETSAKEEGVSITSNDPIDKNAPNYRSLASKAEGAGADCFFYSGITANNAVQVYKDFAAALPDAKLFGADGVAETGFASPKEGGIPANVARRTFVTVAALAPEDYPPEGREFFKDYEQKYGDKSPDPYAIYGYEAMTLALDAIKRAGDKGNDRAAVLEQLQGTENRKSVLGTYSIDDNGDTTLTDYGVYKIEGGEISFDRTIKAKK